MILNKIFILLIIAFVSSCSDGSKIDKWRVTYNHLAIQTYTGFLDETKGVEIWIKALESYCKEEKWERERCHKSIQEYHAEYLQEMKKKDEAREAARKEKEAFEKTYE